jgi:spermidine/putrescine transport system permease protein
VTTAVETVAAPRHRPSVLSRAWALVRRHTLTLFAVLAFAYLLLPIVVVVVFSFNDPIGRFNFAWQGFTLNNWLHPFDYPGLSDAVRLSIEIALASSFFATIIGTLMAMALVRHQFFGQGATNRCG